MSEKYTGKKYDTYATYTAFVRLTGDPKTFDGKTKEGLPRQDVILSFVDNSRIDGNEELWVDARVAPWHSARALKLKKGDPVQISGKLRFKKNDNGELRGKMYDAQMATFADFGRESDSGGGDPVPPAFE